MKIVGMGVEDDMSRVPAFVAVIRPNFFSTLPSNVPNQSVTWGRLTSVLTS